MGTAWPAAADSECRRATRTSMSASRKNFAGAAGKTRVPRSRPSATTPPRAPIWRWTGSSHSHRRNGRHHGGHVTDLRRPNLVGDILSVHQYDIAPGVMSHRDAGDRQQSRHRLLIRRADASRPRLPSHSPVERAGVEMEIPQTRGEPLSDGALPSSSGTIDGDDQTQLRLIYASAAYYRPRPDCVNDSNSLASKPGNEVSMHPASSIRVGASATSPAIASDIA